MKSLIPGTGPVCTPQTLVASFMKMATRHCFHMKYKSFGPYSFIEYKCTELNKAMATTVYYSISQNLTQSFHLPEDALHEILIKMAPYTFYYFDSADGWRRCTICILMPALSFQIRWAYKQTLKKWFLDREIKLILNCGMNGIFVIIIFDKWLHVS